MVRTLLSAAKKVWVTIPAWEELLRPYAPPQLPLEWLPVPSAIPVHANPADAERVRLRLLGGRRYLLGHFGTYGPHVAPQLRAVVAELLETIPDANVLLLGRGGERFREILRRGRADASRLIAPGEQSVTDLSMHLAACDLFVQPHDAGISARNSSLMACLSHGRAVAATAGRLTEPIWRNSNALALVGEHDAAAMGAAVRPLLADDDRRSALERAAEKLYQDEFDVRHLIRRLLGEQARTPQYAHRDIDSISA
jgi:glycosyltransferase involved in cell wall biosynthesis